MFSPAADQSRPLSSTARFRPRAVRGRAKDLPQFYYHTHFCEMLDTVQRLYADVLDDGPRRFITQFRALPFPAQCAYVRIAGRKGRVFDITKLNYSEITRFDAQIEVLKSAGFVRALPPDDIGDYLSVLTKPELVAVMDEHLCKGAFKRSWTKPILIDAALSHINPTVVDIPNTVIKQGQSDPLRFLLYLYFGKIEDTLQPFTLRDLGLVKTPDYKGDISARFDSAHDARTAFFFAQALHDFRSGDDPRVAALIDTVADWPAPACHHSEAARDKLLQKLGGLSERLDDVPTALSLYDRSQTPLCNERAIRLRYARNEGNDRAFVKAQLEAMIDNPGSDGEHDFASDFYARKFRKKRTSHVTDLLRGSVTLSLDEAFRASPEAAAARHYRAQGYEVMRAENAPWKMLFGLLFWEQLFGQDAASLHSQFDLLPTGLKTGQFYDTHSKAVERQLQILSTPKRALIEILKNHTRHHGTHNGIFRWRTGTLDAVKTLLETAPACGLQSMLRIMAQDYRGQKDGYPDLMRVKDGALSFVEIKAEGDSIRRNQMTRLRQLQSCGFDAHIARVNWVIDPHQIYVVVDIETTGGRAGDHRITEIGAVKMRGDEVIEEWSSLINPERAIPPNITRLTGITDAMVADAPRFAEVADDFAAFMGEAIFAAHNVNFDYGFIKMEYGRLDRHFRFPKICTCASMRKLYPGYRSYSLKNLCQNFGIDLTSHHRALCDAKAAAELLILVNEKRRENAA